MATKDVEQGVDNPAGPPPAYSADMPPPENYGSTAPPEYRYTSSSGTDAPPSYDSLYGRMQRAKEESSGPADFLKKFLFIVLGTIGCTIFVGIILAIPITSIVLGSMYLHDCRIERYIPIYLIVAGVFGVIKGISDLAQRLKKKFEEDENEENVASKNPFDGFIMCFLLGWFIAGNVWIYRVYGDVSYDSSSPNYCHRTLYLYAFWSTTATYIMMAMCCCCLCCAGIFGATKARNS